MASSAATTVSDYLASLPVDRREVVSQLRKVILAALPPGYEEVMNGMIVYQVPLNRYPNTYNKQPLAFAGIASQKHYISLYLVMLSDSPDGEESFKEAHQATGKKLNMGRCCIRFKKVEDLSLDLIAQTVAAYPVDVFIKNVEVVHGSKR